MPELEPIKNGQGVMVGWTDGEDENELNHPDRLPKEENIGGFNGDEFVCKICDARFADYGDLHFHYDIEHNSFEF